MDRPPDARIDQVAENARQTSASVESQAALLVNLQARVTALEAQLEAARGALERGADRIEHLALSLDASAHLASLDTQIEGALSAQHHLADRLEQVVAQLGRIERLETAQSRARAETAAAIDARAAELRAEMRGLGEQRGRDRDETGRAITGVVDRIAALETLRDRVTGAERRQTESDGTIAQLAARVDEVAAERTLIEEASRRAEHHALSRIDALAAEVEALRGDVAAWRARIDGQEETVREARGVAEAMREEARNMHAAHHATAEAQRIAEGRVESSLAAIRQESDGRWAAFLQQRRVDWGGLERARSDRAAVLEALAQEARDTALALAPLEARLEAGIAAQARALQALRRELADTMGVWRTAAADVSAIIEGGLPPDEQSLVSAERREAMRRALRARRAAREE
jgi:chromosome segregation ATPase